MSDEGWNPILRDEDEEERGFVSQDRPKEGGLRQALATPLMEQWWTQQPFDVLVKGGLFALAILTGIYSIAFFAPIVFSYGNWALEAHVHALVVFIASFVMFTLSILLLLLALVDGHFIGREIVFLTAQGTEDVVGLRDRTFSILVAGGMAFLHLVVAVLFVIWFVSHRNIEKLAGQRAYSRAFSQYIGICSIGGVLYVAAPLLFFALAYTNILYRRVLHILYISEVIPKSD